MRLTPASVLLAAIGTTAPFSAMSGAVNSMSLLSTGLTPSRLERLVIRLGVERGLAERRFGARRQHAGRQQQRGHAGTLREHLAPRLHPLFASASLLAAAESAEAQL